jgi:hypothetical protein
MKKVYAMSDVSRDIEGYVLQFPVALCLCPLSCTVDMFKSHIHEALLKSCVEKDGNTVLNIS